VYPVCPGVTTLVPTVFSLAWLSERVSELILQKEKNRRGRNSNSPRTDYQGVSETSPLVLFLNIYTKVVEKIQNSCRI
jgi:hypothetical protein